MKQIRSRLLTGSIGLEGRWSEWMNWDERLSGHIQLMQNREYQYREGGMSDGRTMLGGRRYKVIREVLDAKWNAEQSVMEHGEDLLVTSKVFDAFEDVARHAEIKAKRDRQ